MNRIQIQPEKVILDATCGSRTIWFDKKHPNALYCDIREEELAQIWGDSEITLLVKPDIICDFTNLPFDNDTFHLVVFDPPHLVKAGKTSWLIKKYGRLEKNWPRMLRDGFIECKRVLKPNGVLIFKWSEYDIPAKTLWSAIGEKPLFGHHSGKKSKTFWGCFMKFKEDDEC